MMKLRRIVYPLFFVLVLALIIIPSTPLAHATPPTAVAQAIGNCPSGPVNCAVTFTATSGDFLIITIQVAGSVCGANGPSVTDTFLNSYTKLYYTSGSDVNLGIFTTTTQTSGSDTITASCVGGSLLTTTVVEWFGVGSIGNFNNPVENSHTGGYTDTVTLTTSTDSAVFEPFLLNEATGGQSCSSDTITGTFQNPIESTCETFSQFYYLTTWSSSPSAGANSFGLVVSGSGVCGATCHAVHGVIELKPPSGGSSSNLGSLTACYGDCGNPAVTLQNGNSTHLVNFNTSITLFYRFQSNLNGFLLNETINVAKTYTNGEQVGLGIYTATCNAGVTPFTSACPGQQRAATISNPSVPKGKFSLVPSPISVTVGMWIAIGFTAIYAGLDLNVTNAACLPNQNPVNSGICDTVGMQYTTGTIPQLLSSSTKCSQTGTPCNVGVDATGVWSWITGNTVTTPPPIGGSQGCGGDIVCFMTSSACALTPSNCLIGALAFGLIYSFISIILLEVVSVKIGSGMTIPGGVYVLTFMGWMTFWTLIVGAIWFVVLEILAVILLFSAFFGTMVTGQYRNSGKGGRDA